MKSQALKSKRKPNIIKTIQLAKESQETNFLTSHSKQMHLSEKPQRETANGEFYIEAENLNGKLCEVYQYRRSFAAAVVAAKSECFRLFYSIITFAPISNLYGSFSIAAVIPIDGTQIQTLTLILSAFEAF